MSFSFSSLLVPKTHYKCCQVEFVLLWGKRRSLFHICPSDFDVSFQEFKSVFLKNSVQRIQVSFLVIISLPEGPIKQ